MTSSVKRTSWPPILVIGRSGQIAASLRAISDEETTFLCLGRHEGIDITDPVSLRVALDDHSPDVVVNAAAYTSVDRAESAAEAALAVNAGGIATLAALCDERGIPIIHLSSDYVFDGRKQAPYVEEDKVSPLNVYGASKAAGEAALRDNTGRYVILRTSWLYSRFGTNFVKTMLRVAQTQEEIAVVADQWGCPTAADDVVVAIKAIAVRLRQGSGAFGVFHLAGAEAATWFDFANGIFDVEAGRGVKRPRVVALSSDQYPTAATRPRDSRLDCGKIAAAYGLVLPSWRRSLEHVLAQLPTGLETKV